MSPPQAGEDIEAWQLARELTRKVYGLSKKTKFARDFGLKRQIQDAAGSSMHTSRRIRFGDKSGVYSLSSIRKTVLH